MRVLNRLPILPRLLLKALLVMLIPLQFQFSNIQEFFLLPLYGLLFTPWVSSYPYFFDTMQIGPSFVALDIGYNFLLGLFLSFPAIVFNYRLLKSPVNKPFRNLAIGIMVISAFLIFMALIIVVPIFSPSYYYNYLLSYNLQVFPTIAIGAFVILPMIQKQAVQIASPEELHNNTMREIEMNPRLKVRREKTLATMLWIGLFFFPYMMINMGSYYYSQTMMISFTYSLTIYSDTYILVNYGFPTVYGSAVSYLFLPLLGILSALRFVFVRDIYRYLKHEIAYRRMMYMGILGDIFPIICYSIITGIMSSWIVISFDQLPLPFLIVIGLLVVRLHRSVLPYANRIWEDVEARMWFEAKREIEPAIAVPEKPYRPIEEIITVPFGYIVISSIRKRRHNNHSNSDDEN